MPPPLKIYETPDGKDCLPKTLETTAYATAGGLFWSVYEMIGRSKPTTAPGIAARFFYFTPPAAAMGAVFGTSVCFAAAARGGKDGPLNHAIGGLATASIIGAKYKSYKWAAIFGGLFAVVAALTKEVAINDLTFLPNTVQDRGTFLNTKYLYIGQRKNVDQYREQ